MKWYMVFEAEPDPEIQHKWDKFSQSGVQADRPQGIGPNRRKKVTNVKPKSGNYRRWKPASRKRPLNNKGQGPRT